VDYQNKKVVDMIGKELNFQVRLDLKYRSVEYIFNSILMSNNDDSALRTSTGGSETLEAKDSLDLSKLCCRFLIYPSLETSIPLLNALKTNSGENSPAKSNPISRSATLTKGNTGGGGLSLFFLEIKDTNSFK